MLTQLEFELEITEFYLQAFTNELPGYQFNLKLQYIYYVRQSV